MVSGARVIAYGMALEVQRRLRLPHRWVDAYVAPSNFVAAMLARAGYPRDRIHTIAHGTPIADSLSPIGDYAAVVRTALEGEGSRGTARRVAARAAGATCDRRRRTACPSRFYRGGRDDLLPRPGRAGEGGGTCTGFAIHDRAARSCCFEVQPFSVLESMAVGRPVVASRLGGLAEIVDDGVNGVLVAPQDPGALATAMEELWTDRNRTAELGVSAWAYARAHFSPGEQAAGLAELYARLLAAGRA